jgi:hypothetical protein
MKSVLAGLIALAATAVFANEPVDELQLSAEARRPDLVRGTVDLKVGVAVPASAADLEVLVLDATRSPWPGVERVDASTLRIPVGKAGIHEILIEATATICGRAVRTETALRVPFGVADPIVDDGEVAVFAMEPAR